MDGDEAHGLPRTTDSRCRGDKRARALLVSEQHIAARTSRLTAPSTELRITRWADVLAPLVIVVAALPMRLANIGSYSGKADEGTRAAQLQLMEAGFRPVRDIFASQGPLSLDVFYPFFSLHGGTLAGARLAVVVYSLLGLLGVYWLGRLVGGRAGGWAAAALLLLSPTYLVNSRLALVEVPALVPATFALGAALAYGLDGRRRWLIASAIGLALALSIKPMLLSVVPAIGLALLLRRGARPGDLLRDLALYAAVALGLAGTIVLVAGPVELYDQLVRYRVGSRQVEGWRLRDNWTMLWGELRWDGPAFFALAAVGGLLLAVVRPRLGLPLVAWTVATFLLLLVYSPLGTKHAVLQPPPTAALAGAGLGVTWRLLSPGWRTVTSGRLSAGQLAAATCAAMLLPYVWSLPGVVARDRQTMGVGDAGEQPYREEIGLIQALTAPGDYILVDDAYLAFLSRRLMPPKLVDTSIFRIRSGALSGADVVVEAEKFDVRLMLLLSDNLRELKKFRDWVDEAFVVVKINERPNRKDRALYLSADADLERARAELRRQTAELRQVNAELAGEVRVRGFAVDQAELRAGASANLTVEWEGTAPTSVDWRAVTFLRDRDGRLADQTERSLGGGSGGTSTWAPGRWVFRTSSLQVPPRTPAGEYTVGLGLYDSRTRRMATVTAGRDSGGEEVRLGTIRVREAR